MAYDGEHIRILKRGGVQAWNNWRIRNPGLWPDLVRADLRGQDLRDINFFTADLRSADLSGCNLERANLSGSILIWTNLSNANLKHASLDMANLNGTTLSGADLSFATMGVTILADVDLRNVHGLESVDHISRSHVGVDTLYRSQGMIPVDFLAKTGLPKDVVERLEPFVNSISAYYSCFISYSAADESFANRLYIDLCNRGVQCWFAAEDMKIGTKIRVSLDQAIGQHDKLLLVLSETSVKSQWVEQEVERALEIERREDRLVLFPVRIDDTVFGMLPGWSSLVRNSLHIGDFRNWQDESSYTKALSRLVRDLKSPVPS